MFQLVARTVLYHRDHTPVIGIRNARTPGQPLASSVNGGVFMPDITIACHDVNTATLSSIALDRFSRSFRGLVPHRESSGYDEARQVWNGMIDPGPALIARCVTTADVSNTVVPARQHGLLVAMKGGGHNVAGNAACTGSNPKRATATTSSSTQHARVARLINRQSTDSQKLFA